MSYTVTEPIRFEEHRKVKKCTKCSAKGLCKEHEGLYGAHDVVTCNNCTADKLCTTHYNAMMDYSSRQAKVTEVKKPIIEKSYEKQAQVIRHDEAPRLESDQGATMVEKHMEAPIIETHIQQPIIKEHHKDVLHEHHQDVVLEHHKNIVHEHHQPVIHEVHQPIIHTQEIKEIHQPIIHEKHQDVIHELHKPVIHEEQKQIVEESVRAPEVTERTEKTIVTQEQRPTVVEKHIEKPIVSEEIGTQQLIKCDKQSCDDSTHQHYVSEEKQGLGSKIKGVFSDIKSSITGERQEEKRL